MAINNDEEDDDYMNMTFTDPTPANPTSSLRKKEESRRLAALRAQPKSKKDLEAEAVLKREAALSTTLDPSNKGAKLMAKLGYKGGALGKTEDARVQPIRVSMKEDRGGIGADSEKKRKIRETLEAAQGKEKRIKAEEGEYRERNRREREEKRHEGMMWGAMRIAEKFDTEAEEDRRQDGSGKTSGDSNNTGEKGSTPSYTKPNVLWRALVVQRADRDRERKLRHKMAQGFGNDSDEDADDRIALGTEVEDIEQEDPELNDFTALGTAERLGKIVDYLRDTYNYCFYCKFRYPDSDMEGCPGLTEEDHD